MQERRIIKQSASSKYGCETDVARGMAEPCGYEVIKATSRGTVRRGMSNDDVWPESQSGAASSAHTCEPPQHKTAVAHMSRSGTDVRASENLPSRSAPVAFAAAFAAAAFART